MNSTSDEIGFYLLGALAHLKQEKSGVAVFGLSQVQEWAKNYWKCELSLLQAVRSKQWLVDNELIEERVLGYAITELGIEYLAYHLPDFLPVAPLYDERGGLKLQITSNQAGTKAAKRAH